VLWSLAIIIVSIPGNFLHQAFLQISFREITVVIFAIKTLYPHARAHFHAYHLQDSQLDYEFD
jgi:hypothetical protein